MKKVILAIAFLAAGITAAEAKCSTKSLNGNWQNSDPLSGGSNILNFNNGNITDSGAPIGTVTLNDKCRGTLLSGGITFKIRTERIEKTSGMNPNHMTIGFDDGAGNGILFTLQRY